MNFAILVKAAPSQQGAVSAYQFCQTILAKGHLINRIFFYGDGVLNANHFIVAPQDEINLVNKWSQLAREYSVELIICISSALRRGVLDQGEADRYEKPAPNLAEGFKISGLGQLLEASTNADRFIVFK